MEYKRCITIKEPSTDNIVSFYDSFEDIDYRLFSFSDDQPTTLNKNAYDMVSKQACRGFVKISGILFGVNLINVERVNNNITRVYLELGSYSENDYYTSIRLEFDFANNQMSCYWLET